MRVFGHQTTGSDDSSSWSFEKTEHRPAPVPTGSGLGRPLFDRVGRGLELTEHGRIVQRYAESIFELGVDMRETLAGKPSGRYLTYFGSLEDELREQDDASIDDLPTIVESHGFGTTFTLLGR